jgi:hypothetical protein
MTPTEIDEVLRLLREGAKVTAGSSSDYSEWSFRDGAYVDDAFDQGRRSSTVLTEDRMRAQIASVPGPFRELLARPR